MAYALSYAVIVIISGPSVIMVNAQALTRGTRAVMACVLGDLLGD